MQRKIVIVRHFESEGNVNRKSYEIRPDYAIRLTKRGLEKAPHTSKQISDIEGNFDVLLSPYFRTRGTFDHIKNLVGENRFNSVEESPCLVEQEWSGHPKPYDTLGDDWRNKIGSFYYRFDNAESGKDVYNRLLLFHISKVEPLIKSKDQNILIVTHGYSARIYLKILLGLTVEEMELMRNFKNGEVIEVAIKEDGKFTLESKLNIRPKRLAEFHYDKNDLYDPNEGKQ